MDIKASVNLYNKPDGNIKAFASISLNDDFIVRGLRVVEGEKGLFVAMPSQKVGSDYRDVCFPKSTELREEINSTVLEAYEQAMTESQEQANEKTKRGSKKEQNNEQKAGKGNKQEESEPDLQEDGPIEEEPSMSM